MKPKKSQKANLENKRGIFLQIGVLITLTLLLVAFEWSSIPNYEAFDLGTGYEFIDEVYPEPIREELPKPPPPPEPQDILVMVEKIDPLKREYIPVDAEPEPGEEIPLPEMPPEEEVIETLPSYAVSEQPGFQGGGLEGFRNWVMSNLQYPELATENGISGKVFIKFTVNYQGKVQDIHVVRGVDPALDNESIRVVSSSPVWSPGKQGIRSVNVVFYMPISFVLN